MALGPHPPCSSLSLLLVDDDLGIARVATTPPWTRSGMLRLPRCRTMVELLTGKYGFVRKVQNMLLGELFRRVVHWARSKNDLDGEVR